MSNDDSEYRRRQLQVARLNKAISLLNEHFSGVVILAHENLQQHNTIRYCVESGDPLAVRYHTEKWIETENRYFSHVDLVNKIQQHPPGQDDESSGFSGVPT